jgi:hypothetical protein
MGLRWLFCGITTLSGYNGVPVRHLKYNTCGVRPDLAPTDAPHSLYCHTAKKKKSIGKPWQAHVSVKASTAGHGCSLNSTPPTKASKVWHVQNGNSGLGHQ